MEGLLDMRVRLECSLRRMTLPEPSPLIAWPFMSMVSDWLSAMHTVLLVFQSASMTSVFPSPYAADLAESQSV